MLTTWHPLRGYRWRSQIPFGSQLRGETASSDLHMRNAWRLLTRAAWKVQHLEITTMIGCKVACVYCPQDKISRRYFGADRMMQFDDFTTYIERVPKHVMVHFTGFAEPFLNPRCTDMIEYAAHRRHPIFVSTTLAGMTHEDIKRLSQLKYYQFQIHLPSAEKAMNLAINDEYFSLLADLVSSGIITDLHFHGNEVHPAVGAWLRDHALAFMDFQLQDRAGNLNTGKVKARNDDSDRNSGETKWQAPLRSDLSECIAAEWDVVLC